jgi:CRP/FNR family cyclic AMP-dependent transcriptional regulator
VTEVKITKIYKDDILMIAGEKSSDLFLINKGRILIFVQNGSQITPLAYLGAKEYIGELSFFDDSNRSASAIALTETEIIKIAGPDNHNLLPQWLKILGSQITKKIRINDELIRSKGIRRTQVETIKPLSIEEQTRIYHIIENAKVKRQ